MSVFVMVIGVSVLSEKSETGGLVAKQSRAVQDRAMPRTWKSSVCFQ